MSEQLTLVTYNLTLTNANTEYSQSLAGAVYFTIQARTAVDVRFAFVTGKVATPTAPYMTMKSGTSYSVPEKFGGPVDLTLYAASGGAGAVVEILAYYARNTF